MDYEAIIAQKDAQIAQLIHELNQLKKLIFGSKGERFVPTPIDVNQGSLFAEETTPTSSEPDDEKQTITYSRTAPKKHEGRNKIPEHLPVQEVIIEPTEDLTGCIKIGEEITETLIYHRASLVKLVTKRNKYKTPEGEIIIGDLPERPIDKSIAEPSLLAHICVSKFIDHLPFYRQIQMFKRDFQWDLSSSTINDWYASVCALLKPLYDLMRTKVIESQYIQADESPIKVLDSDKKGSTHQGYQWVYHSVGESIVLFDYRKGRGQNGPKEILQNYQGYIQTDGYGVYDKITQSNPAMYHVACLAHVRRKYIEAQDNDKIRANHALTLIGEIYNHERICKEYTHEQRKAYRLQNSKPIMEQLKEWIEDQSIKVVPKSAIGQAMNYHQNQMQKLMTIFDNGAIEIDNNLIENKIRPLALGRKNYLFAGSHEGARRMAMMYTFFGTCKANDINPTDWLIYVFDNIKNTKLSQLHKLIPDKNYM